jgi:DNA-binding transcriptional MerR regulator
MAEKETRLTTGPAARRAHVSEGLIRLAARDGRLPCEETVGGIRIFRAADVDRFAAGRGGRRTAQAS